MCEKNSKDSTFLEKITPILLEYFRNFSFTLVLILFYVFSMALSKQFSIDLKQDYCLYNFINVFLKILVVGCIILICISLCLNIFNVKKQIEEIKITKICRKILAFFCYLIAIFLVLLAIFLYSIQTEELVKKIFS